MNTQFKSLPEFVAVQIERASRYSFFKPVPFVRAWITFHGFFFFFSILQRVLGFVVFQILMFSNSFFIGLLLYLFRCNLLLVYLWSVPTGVTTRSTDKFIKTRSPHQIFFFLYWKILSKENNSQGQDRKNIHLSKTIKMLERLVEIWTHLNTTHRFFFCDC